MLQLSRYLYRQTLARSIGQSIISGHASSSRLRATRISQPRPSQSLQVSKPRYFTISHSLLAESSTTTNTDNAPFSSNSQPPKPPRKRGYYYATLFLLLGTIGGILVRITITPPPLPSLGSDEDIYLQNKIQAQGAALPIVQRLTADPAWTSWDAYAGIYSPPDGGSQGPSVARSRITSGPMSGSSGLAFQRIFHNAGTGELVTVVYFGAALAGWPGVVHGGALATVLDETLGRCAILTFPSRTGVTANLELQYRAPTLTNNFYVIRAAPVIGEDGIGKNDRKLWVRGTLETEKGRAAVEAKALFVVPKGYKLRPLVEGF